jgi:3-hydroxyacyl-[acyl-carrier-protein] dehydratase
MRWFLFDRFIEFQSGHRAVGLKNVTIAEDYMLDFLPGYPVMPGSLILEGLAQIGGLLVGETNQFQERVVLAKVARVDFHSLARPGDTLRYTATIENIGRDGAFVVGTSHLGEQLQAEFEYYLVILGSRNETRDLFEPAELLRMLRALRLYEVGRKQDGSPLEIPPRLLEAERRANMARGPQL